MKISIDDKDLHAWIRYHARRVLNRDYQRGVITFDAVALADEIASKAATAILSDAIKEDDTEPEKG